MGRTTTLLFIFAGISLIFYLGGLLNECTDDFGCTSSTATSSLLDMALKPGEARTSNLGNQLALIAAGVGLVGALVIGIVTRNLEFSIKFLVVPIIFAIGWDFLFVFNKLNEISTVLAVIIFGPLSVFYIMTIIDFMFNKD